MRNISLRIAITLLLTTTCCGIACKYRCEYKVSSDAKYKSCYIKKQLMCEERRTLTDKLTSIQYFSGANNLDSIYIYDTVSNSLDYSCHYQARKFVKRVAYWPNGITKEIFNISKIDTVEAPKDPTTHVIKSIYYYNGYVFQFRETGIIEKEGSISKNEHRGIWIYYDASGNITGRDTLN